MSHRTTCLMPLPPTVSKQLGAIAQIKRLLERRDADPQIRHQLASDPRAAGLTCGIDIDCEDIRPLWDEQWESANPGAPFSELTQAFRSFEECARGLRSSYRTRSAPSDPRFASWRERQMQRADGQLTAGRGLTLTHTPLAFELSKGCSVGCAFCGIAAGRLTAVFRHTEENRALWREVLAVVSDICGEAAQRSILYWATDPFDNPDYEQFCVDFDEVTGGFPITTTALAMKDAGRTGTFLRLSEERGCWSNRFSVHSVKMMERLHQMFTADELLYTQCVPMNSESVVVKTPSGRFRARILADPRLLEREREKLHRIPPSASGELPVDDLPQTSACVSGFVVNMVDRSIRLVAPCPAGDRWPLGFMIFDEASFTDAASFRQKIERMISTHMGETLDERRTLRFRSDVRYEPTGEGFDLVAPSRRLRFADAAAPEYLRELGAGIVRGMQPAGALALTTYYATAVPVETSLSTLELLFSMGVLDEEPEMKSV